MKAMKISLLPFIAMDDNGGWNKKPVWLSQSISPFTVQSHPVIDLEIGKKEESD